MLQLGLPSNCQLCDCAVPVFEGIAPARSELAVLHLLLPANLKTFSSSASCCCTKAPAGLDNFSPQVDSETKRAVEERLQSVQEDLLWLEGGSCWSYLDVFQG